MAALELGAAIDVPVTKFTKAPGAQS